MKTLKILISGYYGFDNLGDELILQVLLDQLQKINRQTEIVVFSAQPEKTRAEFKVNSVDRWNCQGIVREIKKTDYLISGGGGLLQDNTSSLSLYYYLAIILLAKLFRKKIIIYNQGIGPLKSWFNLCLVKLTLRSVNWLSVRDNFSQDLLFSLGLRECELSADPVLNLSSQISKFSQPREQNIWGIIPRLNDKSVENLLPQLSAFAEKQKAVLWIIPFQLSSPERDYAQKIIGIFPAIKLQFCSNRQEILSIFSQLNFVISWRYHGILLSALYKKPLAGIGKDPKIKNLLKELDRDCFDDAQNTNFITFLTKNMAQIDYSRLPNLILRAKKAEEKFRQVISSCSKSLFVDGKGNKNIA